jgi:hypothetical protein
LVRSPSPPSYLECKMLRRISRMVRIVIRRQ